MNKIEIFDKKIISIITDSDSDTQLKFLKIYPAFKSKSDKLIDIWLGIYTDIMNAIELKSSQFNKLELDSLQLNKTNTINFLSLALFHNLVLYKTTDIFKILDKMKKLDESDTDINLIKTSVLEGRSQIKKIQSVQSIQSIENKIQSESKTSTIRDYLAKDIALELTSNALIILKKITYHELISVSQNDTNPINSTNILPSLDLIQNFRELSYMVPTLLLIHDKDNSKRIKTIKHLLKICDALKDLCNYHSLFAIVAGLSNNICQKIPGLWKPNASYTEYFNELSQLISPINNYRGYREIISKNKKSSMIPYIGVTILDIKHLLEYELYDFEANDFNSYMCDKLLEIIENFKCVQLNYKIRTNDQVCKWITSFSVCEDETYLDKLLSVIKDDQFDPQQLSISNDDPKSDGSGGSVNSVPQLSSNKSFRIFKSIPFTNSSESPDSPKSPNSPNSPNSPKSPKSPKSPRLLTSLISFGTKTPRFNDTPIFIESSRSRASSKSKESPRTDNESPISKSVETEPHIEPISESQIELISKPPTESISEFPIEPISETQIELIPETQVEPIPESNIDIKISPPKKNSNQKISTKEKKTRRQKSSTLPSYILNGNVSIWTPEHVGKWLQTIGLEVYRDIFIEEEINGFVLVELTHDNLKNDLHVEKLGHRLTILKAISLLKT